MRPEDTRNSSPRIFVMTRPDELPDYMRNRYEHHKILASLDAAIKRIPPKSTPKEELPHVEEPPKAEFITYADGYGDWHVLVPYTMYATISRKRLERATKELHEQIKFRYTTPTWEPPKPTLQVSAIEADAIDFVESYDHIKHAGDANE